MKHRIWGPTAFRVSAGNRGPDLVALAGSHPLAVHESIFERVVKQIVGSLLGSGAISGTLKAWEILVLLAGFGRRNKSKLTALCKNELCWLCEG